MTSTELTKVQQVVANIDHPAFLEQIEGLLPENVPMRRFVQVAKTAIRTKPELLDADQTSLFAAIIRCAQAGLYPDGKEAALVAYKGKVSFLPMITGVAKSIAEFGWLLRTGVVREGDEFDWSEEPMSIVHRPARPGVQRGDFLYAYGIATHADGRRLQRVLDRDDIAKRRAKAQTDKVWNEWEEAMWRKSAGHAVVRVVPLSEGDRARLDRVLASLDTDPADAMEQLYGPESVSEHVDLDSGEITPAAAPDVRESATEPEGASQQADAAAEPPTTLTAVASVPGDEDEEPLPPAAKDALAAAKAAGVAATVVPNGAWKDMTLTQVLEAGEDGTKWLQYVLRNPGKYDDAFVAAVDVFVKGTAQAQAA